MIRINELKRRMLELGLPKSEVARRLGISVHTLNRRFQNPDSFIVDEVRKLVEILNLSAMEATDIFFAE